MSKQFVRFCEVIDVIDTTDVDLIKVRLDPEDKAIEFDKDLPYAFPLLPKAFHVKPKVGESVFVLLSSSDDNYSQRYYIGPVVSQDHRMYFDEFKQASAFMRGSEFNVDKAPSMNRDSNGIMPNNDDIDIRGRKNADIQITNDDVRIKSGVKLVNKGDEHNPYFNEQDPAYIKVKYHPGGLIQQKKESTEATRNSDGTYSLTNNTDYKLLQAGEKEVKSTVTLVADKINLIQNNSKEKEFTTTDRNDLITDDELRRALDEAYKLPYGEKLVEILSKFIDAFVKHTHPFMMMPPVPADGIPELIEKKATLLDKKELLSDTVRFN